MSAPGLLPPSGHVFRVERARGPVWYAKYRLPDGRQVQKKIGAAWSGRGRPPAGYFTERLAEEWLREVLHEASRGTLAGQVRTGMTFADAAAEWLRYVEVDRQRKPSTVAGYEVIVRSRLLPAFGETPVESISTSMIEGWLASLGGAASSRTKALVLPHGILEAGEEGVGASERPGGGSRETAGATARGDSGVLARGGVGAGPRGRVRAGRGDLSHGGVHGVAAGGALGLVLAGCRLHGLGHPRASELRSGSVDDPQVGKDPIGPDGPRRRERARAARPARALGER